MPEHASIFTFYTKDMKSQIQHERCTQEIWREREEGGEEREGEGEADVLYVSAQVLRIPKL